MLTLSSDFGSPYPAAMVGVILGIEDTRLVDVTHELPRQDVRASAFWLREVLPYFPPAVHLAVVDPGVGTDRNALAISAGDHALVGPDNGVLVPVARALADGDPIEAYEIPYDTDTPASAIALDATGVTGRWPAAVDSSTFHGRDVFAPAAAHVHAAGITDFHETLELPPVDDYETVTFPEPSSEDDGVVGEVLAVDGFGNVITNVPGAVLEGRFGDHVKVNGVWATARRTYAAVEAGHRVVTVGSHGNVELAVNRGRGDETFGIDPGGRVRLSW